MINVYNGTDNINSIGIADLERVWNDKYITLRELVITTQAPIYKNRLMACEPSQIRSAYASARSLIRDFPDLLGIWYVESVLFATRRTSIIFRLHRRAFFSARH